MISRTKRRVMEQKFNAITKALEIDRIIPRLTFEKKWSMRNARVYALYVSRSLPTFFLRSLKQMFHDAFMKAKIDPSGSVKVGDSHHAPRERLSLKRYVIPRYFVEGKCALPVDTLIVRWKEKGITLQYWKRNARIFVFKGFSLDDLPGDFMYDILKNLDYPKYVVKDAIQFNHVKNLAWIIKAIQTYEVRGLADLGVEKKIINSRGELPSLIFLVIILCAMAFLQFSLLAQWRLIFFSLITFILLESLTLVSIVLISRSLYKKVIEMRHISETNEILSLMGNGGQFDSSDWYDIITCTECSGKIEKVQFVPMGKRDIWEFKYCKKCKKYIAKKKIVSESIEESYSEQK